VIVCIPSIGRSPYLVDLLNVLLDEPIVYGIYLYDNSKEAQDGYSPLMDSLSHDSIIRQAVKYGSIVPEFNYPETIYGSWNRAIRKATELEEYVAILNDDLILPPGSLAAAQAVVPGWGLVGLNYFEPDRTPDMNAPVREVHGTYRTTGFGGFAFVLPPHSPEVDSRFQWWCGDDDLAERVKATGRKLGVATGAPVAHPAPSTTGNQMPWVPAACGEDMLLFRELYPDAP
jgi:hypothetical protein